MVKLFISTPCYNALMTVHYTISLLNLMKFCSMNGIDFVLDFLGNDSLITRARNRSLEKFLNTDCTHLLFIDSDIGFPADCIKDLLTFDKDVVGCCYPKKEINFDRLLYSVTTEHESKESLQSRCLNFVFNRIYNDEGIPIEKDNFFKVKHIGTGFMLIKRDIIEKLSEKHKELIILNGENENKPVCALFTCMIKNKEFLSEDYSFCERVK